MRYIQHTYRMFKRFKLYTLINLFGISLGLFCSIVIILYTLFHLSFDNFHVDGDRIFRVSEIATTPDNKEISPSVRYPVGNDLAEYFAEIESYAQVGVQSHKYIIKNEKYSTTVNKVLYVSNNFFNFFTFPLQLGNPHEVLQNEESVVLTCSVAQKLFGAENPIGQIVILNNTSYTVTGVTENPPINSHITFDAITSIKQVVNQPDIYLAWNGGLSIPTFLKLQSKDVQASLEEKIPELVWDKVNKMNEGSGFFTELFLEPLSEIHSKSKVEWDPFGRKDFRSLITLLFVGMVVLIVALINFLFLSRGILTLRLKEFGVKRFLGIKTRNIFYQLLFDNSVVFFISLSMALVAISLIPNTINRVLNEQYIASQLLSHLIEIIGTVSVFVLFSSLLQFAFIKKQLKINTSVTNLASKYKGQKNLWITSIQFAASITLIIAIAVIYKQLSFINNKDLGFKSENIIYVSHDNIGGKQEVLRNELKKIAGVENVSASYGIPGLETTRNGYMPEGSEQWLLFSALYVDDNFFDVFNLEIVKGRGLKKGRDVDKDVFVINETLARQLGWDDPVGKTIFRGSNFEVVGVVNDFHVATMYVKVPPLIISKQMAQYFYNLNIALNTQNLDQTLGELESKWSELMPNIPFNYHFIDQRFEVLYSDVERTAHILIIFASISILISLLGLFALTVLLLNNKIKEIGIRKVNGASVIEVLFWLNKNFIIWVVVSIIIAIPFSYFIMQHWLSQFAYKTNLSWWLFALGGVITLVVTLFTVSLQCLKVARKNPVEALRYE